MLCSVGDFIDTGIDDQMAAMQDSTLENFDDLEEDEELEQDEIQKWVICFIGSLTHEFSVVTNGPLAALHVFFIRLQITSSINIFGFRLPSMSYI